MKTLTRDETEHGKEYVLLSEAEAEIERLERRLAWEEARAARIGTHGPSCHTWGPTHYECALREIERLRELLEQAACDVVRADMERAQIVSAERERCAGICEQEICACCWGDEAQAAAEHLAAEIRKGPNVLGSGLP